MSELDATIQRITKKLALVRETVNPAEIFGADEHEYALNDPLTEAEISEIERYCNVRLPDEYRAFLMSIGDGVNRVTETGGAGPGYGLYSVKTLDEVRECLEQPFPLNHSILGVVELDQTDDYWPTYKEASDRRRYGTLPLAHYGCGIFAALVLRGEAYGTVWINDGACGDLAHFADYSRYFEESLHGRPAPADGPHSFTSWYEDWLDACLNTSPSSAEPPTVHKYLPGAYIVPTKPWMPITTPPCPKCGKPLRTEKARQCFECGASWRE